MRFGSVCSGIEAASVAWHPLGWRASFLSEIEAFPRAVLSHHYPEVPLHGDFTTIRAGEYEPIDLLVGGTPCQSFSVAGLRGGLDDDRGNLALEYLRLADRLRPRWLVWENVPGVLSSNGGRDFGAILGGMVELGYGFAYRVLDAQFLGVAQRRRRVFVVGYLGDWRRAAAVLFERHSLSWHPAPRREAGPSVAALTAQGVGTCGADDNQGQAGHLIDCAPTINATYGEQTGQDYQNGLMVAQTLRARDMAKGVDSDCTDTLIAFNAKDHGADAMSDCSPTLRAGGHSKSHANAGVMQAVAFAVRGREGGAVPEVEGDGSRVGALRAASGGSSRDFVAFQGRGSNIDLGQDVTGTLGLNSDRASGGAPCIAGSAVRRLTPRECERLQGFPDDWTKVPYRGKSPEECADGPRYKALGNSMAVPCMVWIGQRIQQVEAICGQGSDVRETSTLDGRGGRRAA